MVGTIKELSSILIGQRSRIYTDHINLTCNNFNTDRVLKW